VLYLFYLVCTMYCGSFNLFCNVWVCVCVGFVMCGCVCEKKMNVYAENFNSFPGRLCIRN
jgi:hypothetical protein